MTEVGEQALQRRKPGLLQRVWGFDSRHPLWWDVGPPLLVGLSVLVGTSQMHQSVARQWFIAFVCVLFLAPLVWRRRFPFLVYLIGTVPSLLVYMDDLADAPAVGTSAIFMFMMSLFNLALRKEVKYIWWAAGLGSFQIAVELLLTPTGDSLGEALALISSMVTTFLLVIMIALVIKTRRAFHNAEHDRAAREAVAAERSRIAREMHDIIGHNLAVINALADGGAYAAQSSPDRAREALEAIGSTSRQALSELRRVLSVLRAEDSDEAELTPQPSMEDLGPLIERVREAGLPLTFKVTGAPWELSPNQQLAVYRTVQESLTNVLKHATGARRAQISLHYRDDGIEVAVANTGSAVEGGGTMRGLLGLSERATAFGGRMEAGPQPLGGWRVALWMPADNGADQDPLHAATEDETT